MAEEVKPAPRRARKPKVEVEVFDPAYEAHRLKCEGVPIREIARKVGYPSEEAARINMHAYLTRAASELNREQKLERLVVQLDRYEQVLASFWGAMKTGDEKAAGVCLGVLRQIDKLYNLDQPDADTAAVRTIVIGGTREEYIAGLRELAEGAQPA